ncbi:nuclear factor 7, ovary-like [Cololabis saira]|uniref:nuclear factor 7, ovary-like n=1 Tax=Cololabis saira TaxID=129043 RepID=UPI002AD3CEF5|nr:nuclear factor 7, ovary-like [Cololabis saira]
MDEKTLFKDFLSCHVCLETFKDPVSLSCSHNFCSSCLKEFWEEAKNRNCPICKRKSSKEEPGVNLSLKGLADSFAGKETGGSSETEKEEKRVEEVCKKHPGTTPLFCIDEQRAVCSVCEFSLHQNHKVVPVEEAVGELKELLKSDLKSLQDKRNKYKQVEKKYKDVVQHSEKQLLSTEKQIRAEFNKLQQFLKEEEESRLAALREEEEQKGRRISGERKRIQEQISSLSDSISAVEEELQKDNMSFLSRYKPTRDRAREQSSVSDPRLLSGTLVDEAKHLGNLAFRVWEKMGDQVHFSPLVLDPNTAERSLYLSADLTSVRNGDTNQQLPDNPERNVKYSSVFGSEGLTSGKHSWEVEVGDHPGWNIGLVKDSVDRKNERYPSPKYGIWCLFHREGKYSNGDGKTLKVETSLRRIRVQLDYDGGTVSFYNAEDMTHICTYKYTFTEKLFPYFSVGKSGDAKTSEIRICQTNKKLWENISGNVDMLLPTRPHSLLWFGAVVVVLGVVLAMFGVINNGQ